MALYESLWNPHTRRVLVAILAMWVVIAGLGLGWSALRGEEPKSLPTIVTSESIVPTFETLDRAALKGLARVAYRAYQESGDQAAAEVLARAAEVTGCRYKGFALTDPKERDAVAEKLDAGLEPGVRYVLTREQGEVVGVVEDCR